MLFCWPSGSARVRVLFSVAIVFVAAGTESASFLACVITMSYVSASAIIYRLLGWWQT